MFIVGHLAHVCNEKKLPFEAFGFFRFFKKWVYFDGQTLCEKGCCTESSWLFTFFNSETMIGPNKKSWQKWVDSQQRLSNLRFSKQDLGQIHLFFVKLSFLLNFTKSILSKWRDEKKRPSSCGLTHEAKWMQLECVPFAVKFFYVKIHFPMINFGIRMAAWFFVGHKCLWHWDNAGRS